MGLTISYSGTLKPEASLDEMITIVEEVVKVYDWKSHVFEREFPEPEQDENTFDGNIYGICFTPPKCEPVWLCFLSNRRLSTPIALDLYKDIPEEKRENFLYWNFTKTQYAGVHVHFIIIDLLKFLKEKYFSEFKLIDESGYWETGSKEGAVEMFRRYNSLMDILGDALEKIPRKHHPEEPLEDYLERMLLKILEKNQEKNDTQDDE